MQHETDIRKKYILVVDDDAITRELLLKALQQRGYNVALADSVEAAFDILTQPKIKVDLILTDIVMPDRDGFAVLDVINNLTNPIPIIFITGAPERIEEAYSHGGHFAVVRKPIHLERLVDLVKQFLL